MLIQGRVVKVLGCSYSWAGPSMSGFTVLGDTDGEITYRMMVADDVDKVIASLTSAFSGEKYNDQ